MMAMRCGWMVRASKDILNLGWLVAALLTGIKIGQGMIQL
jgi:hypothetical protein